MAVKLGDKVRDPLSGFEGVAVSSHHYLYGCVRFSVQPEVDKDMKLPESQTFDEPQLEVMKPAAVHREPVVSERPGGPERYPDTGRR